MGERQGSREAQAHQGRAAGGAILKLRIILIHVCTPRHSGAPDVVTILPTQPGDTV